MGTGATKENLYSAIEASDVDIARQILKARPDFANQPMTNDCKSLPINRAVWRNNLGMVKMLCEEGADINLPGPRNEPAIMTACKKDNLEMVEYIVELGADFNWKNKNEGDFTSLDMAIAHGNYKVALFLTSKGLKPQKQKIYEDYKEINNLNYCDYGSFLEHLTRGVPNDMAPMFHVRPFQHPVIDPRESWGHMIKRVTEFGEAPLVERTELPAELRPENRFWGKVRSYVNGQNPFPKQKEITQSKYKETAEKNETSVIKITDKSTIQQLDMSIDDPVDANLIFTKK